jgi:arylformamidase
VPDFINVMEAGGSLLPMAEQARRAIAWVYRNAAQIGGDRERLYLCGHSSGAHLAAVALTTDWQRDFDLPADLLKAALCASGLYDLKAARLSARSSYVKFTDPMEDALSPQRHLRWIRTPLTIAYGTLETPEFQRMARDFVAALETAGKPARVLVGQGYNHFEILETLASPYGLLGRAVLEQMNLA